MRRRVPAVAVMGLLGACGFFNGSSAPQGFTGYFHLDRPGRATSLIFDKSDTAYFYDLGCDRPMNGQTQWVGDGEAVVLSQLPGPPRFTQDPSVPGSLVARPGLYSAGPEQWLPGATCLRCPVGDAGVAVVCGEPAVLDGGT